MRVQPGRVSMMQSNWLAANARPVTLPTVAVVERMGEEATMARNDRDISKSTFLRLLDADAGMAEKIGALRAEERIAVQRALAKSVTRPAVLSLAKRFARWQAKDAAECAERWRQLLLLVSYLGIEPAESVEQDEVELDRQLDQTEARA